MLHGLAEVEKGCVGRALCWSLRAAKSSKASLGVQEWTCRPLPESICEFLLGEEGPGRPFGHLGNQVHAVAVPPPP